MSLDISWSELEGAALIKPKVFGDKRGFFMETWSQPKYEALKIDGEFVQDNLSMSGKGIVRGLHYQHPHGQGKLIQVVEGEVADVIVDIRVGSPTFGKSELYLLSSENRHQVFVPTGFAHGFQVLSESALFQYKCTDVYHPECEGGVLWNDPDLNIDWPLESALSSEKDEQYPQLKDIDPESLPKYSP